MTDIIIEVACDRNRNRYRMGVAPVARRIITLAMLIICKNNTKDL